MIIKLVGQVGLEPTQDNPAHLQCAAIAARRLTHMVEPAGIEPATPVSKTGALTAWLYPIIMVIRAGLEPSITALKGLCPDRLDERTIWGAYPVAVPGRDFA